MDVLDDPSIQGCRPRDLMKHHAGVLYLFWWCKQNWRYGHDLFVSRAVQKDETFDSRWHEAEAEACVQRKVVMEGVVGELRACFETALQGAVEYVGLMRHDEEAPKYVSRMRATLGNLDKWLPRVADFNVWALQEYAERRLNILTRSLRMEDAVKRSVPQIAKFTGRVQRLQHEFPRELEKLRVPPDPAMLKAWEDMVYPMRRAMFPRG